MNPLPSSHMGNKQREMPVSRNYLYIIFSAPVKEILSRFPSHSSRRQRCSISRAILLMSLIGFSKRNTPPPPSQRSPTGPLRRERHTSSTHPLITQLSLKVMEGSHSMFPQHCACGERCSVSKDNGLFFHLYLIHSPKITPPNKWGKIYFHGPGSPTRRKVYSRVRPGTPRGSFNDTAISTPVPCILQHGTIHLGFGRTEPH